MPPKMTGRKKPKKTTQGKIDSMKNWAKPKKTGRPANIRKRK